MDSGENLHVLKLKLNPLEYLGVSLGVVTGEGAEWKPHHIKAKFLTPFSPPGPGPCGLSSGTTSLAYKVLNNLALPSHFSFPSVHLCVSVPGVSGKWSYGVEICAVAWETSVALCRAARTLAAAASPAPLP